MTSRELTPSEDYYLELLRNYAYPGLTPRQKRKLYRVDPLIYAIVEGLGRERNT